MTDSTANKRVSQHQHLSMDDATTKTKEILIVETVADETDRTANHEATEEDLETVKIRTTVETTVETKAKTGAAATQEAATVTAATTLDATMADVAKNHAKTTMPRNEPAQNSATRLANEPTQRKRRPDQTRHTPARM